MIVETSMKKTFLNMLVLLGLFMGLVSCDGTTVSTTPYEPSWHYNCYPQYDYWGYYLYDDCYWEFYNQDGSLLERDMVSNVADTEALLLDKLTNVYADKFSLSTEAASKVAKNISDFSALSDRSEADLADFAQKLYGVNPTEIVSAMSSAQVGNNTDLDLVIDQASQNLGTNSANMKAIVKELHGKALEASGIEL
jgi:hypothetical protein